MSAGQAIIYYLLSPILNIFTILLVVYVVLSWLVAFRVINAQNEIVRAVGRGTAAIVEPVLRPIQAVIPPLGGMDFSPIIAFLLVQFLNSWFLQTWLWPRV